MQAIQEKLQQLSAAQLQDLFKKTFNQTQLIEILSQNLSLETVAQIPPAMKVIKTRIYKQLGFSTTKEVKQFAIAESIVAPSADFRKKETWLKVQNWIDNPEVCLLPKAEETQVEAVVEPVSETESLKSAVQTMNVRKLRETAKTVKLPNWGTIVNKQGAEALRSALLQFLG